MTTYNKWDLILVPFPFTDLSSTKKRPALVVSPNPYNKQGDVVIAFVTSNLAGPDRFGDYVLGQWQQAGLPLPSKLRMKFATVSAEIVVKKIGSVQLPDIMNIDGLLQEFFRENYP
jgi:mRNA interferase MazF